MQGFQIIPDGTKLVLAVEKPSSIDKKQLAEHGILYDGSFPVGMPRPLLDEIALDKTAPARGGRIETETWIHDLRDDRERPATEAESNAYSILEDVPSEKLFSKKELEELLVGRAKISPDGRNVVYERLLDPSESAQMVYALFLKPTGGGEPVALTKKGFKSNFWWSADSKEIYYALVDTMVGADDPHPSKSMAVSVTGGKPARSWTRQTSCTVTPQTVPGASWPALTRTIQLPLNSNWLTYPPGKLVYWWMRIRNSRTCGSAQPSGSTFPASTETTFGVISCFRSTTSQASAIP